MAKTICKILGIGFVLVGLIGFAAPNLLGMHLTPIHNVIHLLSGALALYFGFAATFDAARTFCLVFGAVYLLLAVLGFIAPGVVASLLGHSAAGVTAADLTPDNIVHIVLGALFLVGAFVKSPRPVVPA
jgi:hypothetical protein